MLLLRVFYFSLARATIEVCAGRTTAETKKHTSKSGYLLQRNATKSFIRLFYDSLTRDLSAHRGKLCDVAEITHTHFHCRLHSTGDCFFLWMN